MDLTLARRPLSLAAGLLTAALAALGLATVAVAAPAQGTQRASFTRIGRAPVIPAGATARGALPQSASIDVAVALSPRDPAAMAAYAQAVSTPGSALYHRYLTVAQFAQRFGPTASAVASVRAALQAQGLHPGPLAANGLSMDVSSSAARLSSALSTSFERYEVRGGRTAFANTSAPALPSVIAGLVRGVVGLDSLQAPTPAGVVRQPATRRRPATRGSTRSNAAPGSSGACTAATVTGGYTAAQIASAYGFGDLYAAGDGGSGTTVALFELEPYSASDVSNYQSCYGTSAPISNITVDGGPGSGAGSGEAALDIENLIGLAPQASVLVYEGKNTAGGAYDTYRTIISQNRARVISTSWGLCEPQEGTSAAGAENDLFIEAATQGQTIFAASGDHGVQDCTGTHTTSATVDDPASQPYVTGVGGTSLNAVGPPPSETAWNSTWNGGASSGAGGGGVSAFWGAPAYQSGFTIPQSAVTCVVTHGTSCREVPDVSADADIVTGYDIYYSHHWYIFGGTSAAAPTWAALAVLADSSAACSGKNVGFASPALYAAASSAYGNYFNDVTSGNNSYGGLSGFSAGTGYDMATGLGSPNGAAVAAAMCGSTWTPPAAAPSTPGTTTSQTATVPPAPVVTLSHPASQAARVGQPVHVQLHAADSAGQTLTWRTAGLPPGLSISGTTGLISGTPTHAGKATATVSVSDSSGSTATAAIAWNVAGRPSITGGLTVNRQGKPSLALHVAAGTNAPAIESIVIVPSAKIRFARRARDLARGITVRNSSGRRITSAARLRGGDLVVTLRSKTVRAASLRITVPAVALVKHKKSTKGRRKSSALQRLSVTVTDVSAHRTAFFVR
ncbi:MAG: protease pro-enzyme activation domain-containing protein [Solirubrobacteraceae bacterium]